MKCGRFLSIDSNCEGQPKDGLLGYVSTAPLNGHYGLSRYINTSTGYHFEVVDGASENLANYRREGAHGYVPLADLTPVVVAPVVSTPTPISTPTVTPAPVVVSQGVFEAEYYIKRYPDVVTNWTSKGKAAVDHWMQYGRYEGRIAGCGLGIFASKTTIQGAGSLPISLTVDNSKFAGAVSSLTWDGHEFINIKDHGRQLQTAIQIDGYGECNNPTEAGSDHDGVGSTSSSKIMNAEASEARDSLKTKSQLAFWSYNKLTGACTKGIDNRVSNPLSTTILEKTIKIGVDNDNQVIDYNVKVTNAIGSVTQKVVYEFLTGYLNTEFSRFWYVGLGDSSLNEYMSADLKDISGSGFPNGSYAGIARNKDAFDPIIMSTPDGRQAMGVYTPKSAIVNCGSMFHGYNMYKFNLGGTGANSDGTNKWSLALEDGINTTCMMSNERSFRVFIVLGNVDDVSAKLLKIARKYQ